MNNQYSLETDLHADALVKELVQDNEFAIELYCSLCNIRWFKGLKTEEWTCSWRYAGGIVADLRGKGEDYLDFYCSGIGNRAVTEGVVTDRIENELKRLGWTYELYVPCQD